jgi:mRNA-degrading endonuclease toxin of MazEF toxin-antitoxin module
MQAGTIAEFPVPYADGADASGVTEKLRPILVITPPDAMGDVVVLPITGSGHHPHSEALSNTDLSKGSMKKDSYIRVRKPLTINASKLGVHYGRLTTSSLSRIKNAMCAALGCC